MVLACYHDDPVSAVENAQEAVRVFEDHVKPIAQTNGTRFPQECFEDACRVLLQAEGQLTAWQKTHVDTNVSSAGQELFEESLGVLDEEESPDAADISKTAISAKQGEEQEQEQGTVVEDQHDLDAVESVHDADAGDLHLDNDNASVSIPVHLGEQPSQQVGHERKQEVEEHSEPDKMDMDIKLEDLDITDADISTATDRRPGVSSDNHPQYVPQYFGWRAGEQGYITPSGSPPHPAPVVVPAHLQIVPSTPSLGPIQPVLTPSSRHTSTRAQQQDEHGDLVMGENEEDQADDVE